MVFEAVFAAGFLALPHGPLDLHAMVFLLFQKILNLKISHSREAVNNGPAVFPQRVSKNVQAELLSQYHDKDIDEIEASREDQDCRGNSFLDPQSSEKYKRGK